jgi:hypothetical protein
MKRVKKIFIVKVDIKLILLNRIQLIMMIKNISFKEKI